MFHLIIEKVFTYNKQTPCGYLRKKKTAAKKPIVKDTQMH